MIISQSPKLRHYSTPLRFLKENGARSEEQVVPFGGALRLGFRSNRSDSCLTESPANAGLLSGRLFTWPRQISLLIRDLKQAILPAGRRSTARCLAQFQASRRILVIFRRHSGTRPLPSLSPLRRHLARPTPLTSGWPTPHSSRLTRAASVGTAHPFLA